MPGIARKTNEQIVMGRFSSMGEQITTPGAKREWPIALPDSDEQTAQQARHHNGDYEAERN